MSYFSLGMKDVFMPLMALVDYRGFRLVAMSVLPVNSSTLIYGYSILFYFPLFSFFVLFCFLFVSHSSFKNTRCWKDDLQKKQTIQQYHGGNHETP